MRIWIVNPFDNLPLEGYRPQRFWLMAKAFARAGHEVTLWTSDFSHATKKARDLGCTDPEGEGFAIRLVHSWSYRGNVSVRRFVSHWLLACRTKKAMSEEIAKGRGADCVIVSSPTLGLVRAVRKLGLRYVVDVMDAWPETFERVVPRWLLFPLRAIARKNYLGAEKISVVARRYEDLVRSYGYEGSVREFYHGIEVHAANRKCLEIPRCRTGRLRLVYAGNMSKSYDLMTLLDAVAETEGVELTIAGRGPDEKKIAARIGELNVLDRIRSVGYLRSEELEALLSGADVGVVPMFPASCVGVPYKLADYAAAGLRVIESLGGEARDLVERHDAGCHYVSGNVESLKAAIRHELEWAALNGGSVKTGEKNPGEFVPANLTLIDEFNADRIYPEYVKWAGEVRSS